MLRRDEEPERHRWEGARGTACPEHGEGARKSRRGDPQTWSSSRLEGGGAGGRELWA